MADTEQTRESGKQRQGPVWEVTAGIEEKPGPRDRRRGVVWGVFLVSLGALLLLMQVGALRIHLRDFGQWWPAIPVVIGVAMVAAGGRSKTIAEGVGFVLLGIWFFAVTQHWYGLTYLRGWPLLIVIWGFEMVLAAVLDGWSARKEARRA
jgi:hypothetical protein